MNIILKQSVALVLLAMLAVPAHAGETNARTVNKGNKAYQTARMKPQEKSAAMPSKAEDVSKIAPAAGAEMKDETASARKSFKEQMRLPRKN